MHYEMITVLVLTQFILQLQQLGIRIKDVNVLSVFLQIHIQYRTPMHTFYSQLQLFLKKKMIKELE